MDLSRTVENLLNSSLHLQEGFPEGVGIFLPKMTRRLSKQALKVVSGLCQSYLRWMPREGPDPALVCSREKNTVNKVVEQPKLNGEERI